MQHLSVSTLLLIKFLCANERRRPERDTATLGPGLFAVGRMQSGVVCPRQSTVSETAIGNGRLCMRGRQV